MKRIISAALCLIAIAACQEENPYAPTGGKAIEITASADELKLNEDEASKTAVTFTWTKGFEYGDAVSVEYCFKMDVAGNDFATATELEVLGPDVFEKSLTTEELNDLCLERWGITPGEQVMLEAKVIARLTADKFIMPQVAVTSFVVVTYVLPSSPLYIIGSAVKENNGSLSPSSAIQMTEEVPSRLYSYKGEFAKGDFFFISTKDALTPGWFSKDGGNEMEYRTEGQGKRFTIEKESTYRMVVNTKTGILNMIYYPKYENIYMVGDASPGGWTIGDATALTWIEGTSKFEYSGYLKAGELKFAAGERSWDVPFYMAYTESCSDLSIATMRYVEPGGVDYKWVITEANAGNWRITLDIDMLTIKFDKL